MKELVISENEKIENLIYEVRGCQVMLDRDLAKLYGIETRILIQKVKRNQERFPNEFCFQMNSSEFIFWKSQNVMSNNDKIGLRRAPYVFTEQGVAMLSAIIKTDIAVNISIKIMDAFVLMRKYISNNLLEQKYVINQVMKNTEDIRLLQESFEKFEEKKKVNEIYFNGEIYDAYHKIQEIFSEAKKEIIIIDAYADYTLLDIVKRLDVNVAIITKENNLLTRQDIEKYNKQYHNLRVIYDNTFHDRYFILDKSIVYHCGASINRIGYKTFSITLISDKDVSKLLIDKINNKGGINERISN